MNLLQTIIHKLFFRTAERNAEWYKRYTDMKIGNNVKIFPGAGFGSETYLIEIGDNVEITDGVFILTHDSGIKVPMTLGLCKNADLIEGVKIGDNVFIGVNSIVLSGCVIPNNVIIGAGSIITRGTNFLGGVVVCGVPAKVVCTIEEYVKKNRVRIFETDDMDYYSKKRFFDNLSIK